MWAGNLGRKDNKDGREGEKERMWGGGVNNRQGAKEKETEGSCSSGRIEWNENEKRR